jgi:hypothetical protein
MHSDFVGRLELLLTVFFLLAALLAPKLDPSKLDAIGSGMARILTTPMRRMLFIAGLAVVLRAIFLPVLGPPPPLVADEFSMTLQAQTFALGEWAAPPLPLWQHFEAMHLIGQPTYASIYFPGRSAPLLLGLLLSGHPWIGVWIVMIALCVAVTWMLEGWTSPGYALLGGLIVVIRYGVFSYWVNSYWGGAFTALGATLILGAFPRIIKTATWKSGLLLGVGAIMLMTSRPFEGLIFCAAIGLFLCPWLWSRLAERNLLAIAKIALPVALFVAAGGGILLAQSSATTGSPLKAPYELGREQYAIAPALVTSPRIKQTAWVDEHMEHAYRVEAQAYDRFQTPKGIVRAMARKLIELWAFYVGPALTLPFVVGLFVTWRRAPLLPAALGLGLLGFAITTWDFVHYFAPALPLVVVIVVLGLQTMRDWTWKRRPIGYAVAWGLPAIVAVNVLVPASFLLTGWPKIESNHWSRSCCAVAKDSERARITRLLEQTPSRDLVFVHVDPDAEDWVYNSPRPQTADIVWARDLGATNADLLPFFPGRRVWSVRASANAAVLSPYRP